MRLFILLLLCTLLQKESFAQRWLPPGTKLTYSEVDIPAGIPIGMKPSPIYIVDTVTLKGKLCTYASKTASGPFTNWFVTYEEAGVVYWYRSNLDTFTVLFDFNKNIGDTWTIEGLVGGAASPCNREIKILDKKMININGYNLRAITVQFSKGSNPFYNTVVEGIGGLNSPYPDISPCLLDWHVDGVYGYGKLRCVNHPDIGFYDFKEAPSCDYTVTSINENFKENKLSINPNPFVNQFTFSNNNEGFTEMYVYDILGRLILKKTIGKGIQLISTEEWSNGLYMLKLVSAEGSIYQSKLVKS